MCVLYETRLKEHVFIKLQIFSGKITLNNYILEYFILQNI